MKTNGTVTGDRWQVTRTGPRTIYRVTRHVSHVTGFTLVEVLVTLVLLSLIVLALMTVFNSTQNAFRAGLTQTDVLESGRNAMGFMTKDLEAMTPSFGTNWVNGYPSVGKPTEGFLTNTPVNFYVDATPYVPNSNSQPFVQYLPGTITLRSNVLEYFFILSRQNVNGSPSWVGTGYAVDPRSRPTNSLYRFTMTANMIKGSPLGLFNNFYSAMNNNQSFNRNPNPFTNKVIWSHLMDGVVDLTVRPYDPNGYLMTDKTNVYNGQTNILTAAFYPLFTPPITLKLYSCYMYSNTVPASVEVNLGVWEDGTLERSESLSGAAQVNYLSNHVGQVHLFRQRVLIRNVDPSAYQ